MEQREQWSSRFAFVMAAVGSAIGLGNVWRFPYLVAQNGGAAFVLIYLVLLALIGYPVLLSELTIGRAARRSPHLAFSTVSGKPFWDVVGWLAIFAGGFFVLSYYNVVGGWTIKYMLASFTGLMEEAGAGQAGAFFGNFIGMKHEQIIYTVLFMALVMFFIARGVGKGLEWANKYMMSGLFILVIILVVRSLTLPGAGAGVEYYLKPDLSKVTGRTFLAALGQVFFSLSLGLGAMLTYGSYVPKDENIPTVAGWTASLDTGCSLLCGLMVFPAVFAMGFDPNVAGPGLTFVTLPGVFSKLPTGSALFSFLFFLLLFFGAATSAMSLLEAAVVFAKEKFNLKRVDAVWIMGAIILLLGGYSALSLSGDPKVYAPWMGKSIDFFDFMDEFCNNIMLPLGSMLLCLFVGWVWLDPAVKEMTNDGTIKLSWLGIWIWCMRVIAPVAIFVIGAAGLGILKI